MLRAVGAFTSPLLPDDYLELINPLWSTRELRGEIESIDRETPDAATVVIRPGYEWMGHEPGQYLRIGIDIDGRRHWRAYSLTSDPDRPDGRISITIKNVDEGVVSPHLVRRRRPGSLVALGGVEGAFLLPDPLPEKLLFVSAGSGITPIMSMLRSLAHDDSLDDAVLLHSAPTAEEVIFGRRLRALSERHPGFRLHEQLTAEMGRMGPADLDRLCPDWREREVFLSGPAGLLDAMIEHFEQAGRSEHLRMERFQPVIGGEDVEEGEGGLIHRRLALIGRVLLIGSRFRPLWLAGTATLSMAKILENMEIGHNVMHGQWDWMNHPVINSATWDWDSASSAESWKHSHNYVHHTFTNIRGKDKDLGYEIMRIDPEQPWHPVYLLQPAYNLLLMALFEWGVALHDMDQAAIRKGEKGWSEVKRDLKGIWSKGKRQILKDYVTWPLLSGPAAPLTVAANATANVVRNVWSHSIIFCGHFPDQTYTFSEEEVADETKGATYVRQLVGAANIDGGPLFHVISGNLGFQVEHHLFPDMPSTRYGEIAPRVREICERYGLPYNTGPFSTQLGMVHRTILRLAFPGGKPRPKPGPFRREDSDNDVAASPAEAA